MNVTGIILAGGESRRMPGDKALMEVAGRTVIDIQLEVIQGLFDEILVVVNRGRMPVLEGYGSRGVTVIEETVGGMGPLGGIAGGLEASRNRVNFVLACDMPFIRRAAVEYVLSRLEGFQAAVPRTPGGLEPLHAAYDRSCLPAILDCLERGNLKVTRFYEGVSARYVEWEELVRFDPTGRLLLNINSPDDLRRAVLAHGEGEAAGK